MKFYNKSQPYYRGIELHARTLYVCIIVQNGEVCLHKEIPVSPDRLNALFEPFLSQVVVGAKCMHGWYGVCDFCEELGVEFILGHTL